MKGKGVRRVLCGKRILCKISGGGGHVLPKFGVAIGLLQTIPNALRTVRTIILYSKTVGVLKRTPL
jgi:hypothetical protein